MDDLAGLRLGDRFEVLGRADDAGLGVVWHARDAARDEPCVVRALPSGVDPRALEAFVRLQGTRILSLRAAGQLGALAWAAADAPEAPSLAQRLAAARRNQLPFELAEVRALGLALTGALFTAHQSHDGAAGLHGAVTPWSVFVRELSRATCDIAVGDFGVFITATPRLDDPSAAPWLPVAPELDGTSRRATPAADVFAAAMILAEALFPGAARTHLFPAARGPQAIVDALTKLRPGLHPSVRDALASALQRDPSKRPPNANRFARLLRDATWTESTPEDSPSPARAEAPPAPAPDVRPAERPRIEVWVAPARASAPASATPPAPASSVPQETPRARVLTQSHEHGFGPATPATVEPHTLAARRPATPPRDEDTVRSDAAHAAVFLAEPDTELATAPGFEAHAEEMTAPLTRAPTSPIAPAPATAASEVTVALDVQYGKFGKSAAPPPHAVGDSGTVLVAPAAAAAYLHVAEQQRIAPPPDFQETAAVDAATIARASAGAEGVVPTGARQTKAPAPPPEAGLPPWAPAAIVALALVIGVAVFVALARG